MERVRRFIIVLSYWLQPGRLIRFIVAIERLAICRDAYTNDADLRLCLTQALVLRDRVV